MPKISRDNLIPRGPNLDTFARPYDPVSGRIDYDQLPVPPDLVGINSYMENDLNLELALERKPLIDNKQGNSFVRIELTVSDSAGPDQIRHGSGCIVSTRHVFTSGHIFDLIPTQKIKRVLVVTREGSVHLSDELKLDSITKSEFVPRLSASPGFRWDYGGGLDFAVIESRTRFRYNLDEILQISDEPVPWDRLSTICSLGNPRRKAAGEPADFFPHSFLDLLVEWDSMKLNSVLGAYLDCHLNQSPLAFFGTPYAAGSDAKRRSYVISTMSVLSGCSGGPVVSLDHPGQLIGLMLGSWARTEVSVFLDVQTPIVKEAYQYCLAESRKLDK